MGIFFSQKSETLKGYQNLRELKIQRKIHAMLSKAGRQVKELKIQKKNPESAFRVG
jgi:hypothetical protein